jgi:MarR family transcriptional regulator, temperature-dependent positive regulator of motility
MARGRKTVSSPLHLLHRAGQRADFLFAHHVGGHAFTPRQFAVLQAVAEADGLSQTAIMTATGIDRSGTAELVRRLVGAGLLQRRRTKEDARVYAVRLTPQGRKMLSVGERAARAAGAQLLASIPSRQRATFVAALLAIINDA